MVAGWLADLSGDIATTFQFAVVLLIASVFVLPIYHRPAARVRERQQRAVLAPVAAYAVGAAD